MKPFLLLSGALLLSAFAGSVHAQQQSQANPPAFACTAEREGQLTCQANRVCECVFAPAAKAKGLPARFHWDCGILRPQCEITPANGGEFWLPNNYLPNAVVVDARGRIIRRRNLRERAPDGDKKSNPRQN